jgi:hypothetical protein
MIAHIPGHLCVADLALGLGVDRKAVYRLANRWGWRAVRRKGEREVYYRASDVRATPGIRMLDIPTPT